MVDIKTLVGVTSASTSAYEFFIMRDCHWGVTNGGCCAIWQVPVGTSMIKFELVGGGGPGGSSGGDHDHGIGGQGGGYAVKTIYSNPEGPRGFVHAPCVCFDNLHGGSSASATAQVGCDGRLIFSITNAGSGYSPSTAPNVCVWGKCGVPTNCQSIYNGPNARYVAVVNSGSTIINCICAHEDFCSAAGKQTCFTLCAGGTSNCSCCCSCHDSCRHGCPSYVCQYYSGCPICLSSICNMCAVGGRGGYTMTDVNSNCYNCSTSSTQCSKSNYNNGWGNCLCSCPGWKNADYGFPGSAGGTYKDYDCCQNMHSWAGAPVGPFSHSGINGFSQKWCWSGEACLSGHSEFPGGGGAANMVGSSTGCVGGFGAGGLIKVTYQ